MLPLRGITQSAPHNQPQGFFHDDSVKIGQPVGFSFYMYHPATAEVIFPDSTYNFAPFEYVSRRYFPTRTTRGKSLDSVVYTLRTFSIEPKQSLALPVYILQHKDTVSFKSEPTAVYLKQLVPGPALPQNLKAQTTLVPVENRFNFAYWLIAAGIFILVLAFIWMIFGRQLINRYRLYILRKRHSAFIYKFNAFIDFFNNEESLPTIEQAITLWKNYLTELEGNAINSYTTKEIAAYYNDDEDVTTALRLFDKAIYGNIVSDKSSETIIAFYLLHHFADRRYEVIKNQIRNVPVPESLPELV